MNNIQYYNDPLPKLKLDKNRFRVKLCPCSKSNKDGKFVPYVGYENKGYCHSCGETYLPQLPGKDLLNVYHPKCFISKQKPISFIPVDRLESSLYKYEENHFVTFLNNQFGIGISNDLINKYFIGTSKHWQGATVFWQIDINGKIRSGKIMLYSPITGKRIKEPFNHIHWVHKALKLPEFELRQCIFGEHLINQFKSKPIAIVESEKTAIIASVYLPQFIWLAVGSINNLKPEICNVLKGRSVTLYPDLQAYDKWKNKAQELSNIESFTVSDLLEIRASEIDKAGKYDLADYLLKLKPPAPSQLRFESIAQMPCTTNTPKAFNSLILGLVLTKEGKWIELLFDESGELVRQGEMMKAVDKLATFYEKNFQPIHFDGIPCWANFY